MSDIDSVEQLVLTLSHTAVGSDRVAIIPLTRSAPEAVAAQLTQFYSPSLREGEGTITVVPLPNQQAVLVRASDASMMRGIEQIAMQIDRSVADVSDLRVIALTHIQAADIVPQLAQIFGSSSGIPSRQPESGAERARASTGVRSRLRAPQLSAPSDNEDGTGLAVPPPAMAPAPDERSSNSDESRGEGSGGGGGGIARPQEGETRIVADMRTNSILVYSNYSTYKRMREVVETLDVAQAQVVIEATVLEVKLNDQLETGVQFFLQSNGIALGSGAGSMSRDAGLGGMLGVATSIGSVNVDAVIRTLRAVTTLKVVSSPYLTVLDGETARLVIGDQIPFATTSQTSSNSGNVTVTQKIEILDTGVVLEITPRIHGNNSVNLNIVQSVSAPVASASNQGLTPTISTRDITSRILAQSGRTILLGGLIQDRLEKQEDGVPRASKLPVVGGLFRQNRNSASRTELLVLITPRVVRSSSEIENITRLLQGAKAGSGVSTQDLKAR